ncbi:hypothetical protein GUA87_02580 [Sneathiella sp. P13V-1]|uniref:TnsA endonuclease N-terminal domain-containing protein n=1 Tax=Sneathiella sp. P13V-1 TaxID=2697366 RepID=UPI00187B6162|nr:TnsA endonuclease N-terminal domain-containing protein [Sneathiella sp. P13V-1]MBE7635716.1 hypothetical protein [Sneathiella sp. P13V-1]
MTVRRIQKSYRSLTGYVGTSRFGSIQFESTLERDFIELMEFNTQVTNIISQPIKIRYVNSEQAIRHYTPDFLVSYEVSDSNEEETWIYEIKYVDDLHKNCSDLKEKFRAAIRHSKSNQYRFKILTERQIRTPYLENVKILQKHLRYPLPEYWKVVFEVFNNGLATSLDTFVSKHGIEGIQLQELIFVIWQLVARNILITDLNKPLSKDTIISTHPEGI